MQEAHSLRPIDEPATLNNLYTTFQMHSNGNQFVKNIPMLARFDHRTPDQAG
jgi:hypothetical protein